MTFPLSHSLAAQGIETSATIHPNFTSEELTAAALANGEGRPRDKIDQLFVAGLARKPTKKEVGVANKLLAARNGDLPAALQDLWWAVLNSNEFIINH